MDVNFTTHIGLRGAAAIWVMLFHCFFYSKFILDFQGSSIMPLFFLLSGYYVMISSFSGRDHKYAVISSIEDKDDLLSLPEQSNSPRYENFNTLDFHRNRFARVYPTYIVCTFFALPLWFFGYGPISQTNTETIVKSIINSILPLNTVFIFLLGAPIDGPGWTVCSLCIMWIMFPFFISHIRNQSDSQLIRSISFSYWLQLALVLILSISFIDLLGGWPTFCLATMNPFTRFPLFLMGAYAGELTIRIQQGEILLWSNSFLLFFPYCNCCCQCEERNKRIDDNDPRVWTQKATTLSLTLLVVTLLVAFGDGVSRYVGGSDGILGAVWFQAIVPFAQLEVIVALTLADKSSLVVRALSTPVALWLGEVSMCVYLVHYPIIYYICWAIKGTSLVWPTQDCNSIPKGNQTEHDNCIRTYDEFNDDIRMPVWGIPIVVAVTIILSAALFYLIEEPCRKALRKRK